MEARARRSKDLVDATRSRRRVREVSMSSCADFWSTSQSAVSSYSFQASPRTRPIQMEPASWSGRGLMCPMNLDIARSAARCTLVASLPQMRREVSPAPVVGTAKKYVLSVGMPEGGEVRRDEAQKGSVVALGESQ